MAYFDKLDLDPTLIGGGASPEKPKPAGFLRSVADLGIEAASGVARGVKATADAFGADNAVSRGADTVDKFAREYLSAAAKADDQRVSEIMAAAQDAGVWEQVKAAAEAFTVKPAGMVLNAFGTSVPTIAAAMIPGVGQAGVAARLGALGAMGAAQGAGAVKGSIYEAVKAEQIKAGASESEAEAAAVRAQEYGGENTANIAGGAALGAAASATGVQPVIAKLLQRGEQVAAEVGKRGILDRALNPEGLIARTGMGALKEAPLEAAQGGQEQYASNIALQNEGFDTPAFRGVAGAAALEGLASAGPGAAFAALDKPKVADVLGAPTVDEAIKKAEQVLALPAPASGVADELVDGVIALPGPNRPADPPVLRALPAPDGGTVYMVDEAGNVALQPAAARAEAVTRAAEADIADTQQRLAERQRQTELGVTPGLRKAQEDREDSNLPVGEASDAELIPTGEAMELEPIPTGEASEVDVETIQPTDLLARDGQPFGSKTGAQAKAYASGGGKVVAIPNHFGSGIPGYVVRPLMQARPNNTRGTDARDLPRSSNDDQRDLAGSAEQVPGASDGRGADAARSGGAVGLVPAAPGRVDQPAEAPSTGNRPADVVAGAGDADTALTPGSRVTLNGTPYTVTTVNGSAVKLQGADGGTKMVARNSKTFGQIQPEAATAPAEGPGSDAGNGFKQGPKAGERYRVGVVASVGGAVALEKRLPAGTAATFYIGKDGNLIDGDSVNLIGDGKDRLWIPATPEQAQQAQAILDEMGRLELNDPARKDAKARLKALVQGKPTQEPNEAARPQTQAAAGETNAPAAAPAPAAPAVVPGAGPATNEAGRLTVPVRTFGSSGYQLTMAQALAKVKELEADARRRKTASTKAPTAIMRGIEEDAASRAATLARKLREDIKQAVNSYPDARAEYAEARGEAQPASVAVEADGVDDSIDPFTLDKRTLNARIDRLVSAGEAADSISGFMELRKRYMKATGKPSIPPAGSRFVALYPDGATPNAEAPVQAAPRGAEADVSTSAPNLNTSAERVQKPPESEQVARTPKAQAVKEALAAKKGAQPAPVATHKDPGEPAEPVTPAVVREAIKTAADNRDRPIKDVKADALRLIDEAMPNAKPADDMDVLMYEATAPGAKMTAEQQAEYKRLSGQARDKYMQRLANELAAQHERAANNIGYVTIKVPGDGVFKILNTAARLAEFRKKIEASPGFKAQRPGPIESDRVNGGGTRQDAGARFGVESGSGGKVAAFDNMVNDGDLEAASDYADAVGLELDPKKVANATKVLKWRETRPAEAAPAPAAEAPAAAPAPTAEPDALPNPWEISQDEFVRRATFTKEGSTAFPWVAKWGDRILEAENEVFDHPDLGKTVVQGGRFSKTKREAETVARGAHKRAVRRGVLNGNTATPEALAAYPDLQPAKPATPAAQAPAGRDEQPEAQAPAKPAPKSFRKSVKVKTAVFMEETGAFAEQEIDADTAIKALEADIAELQAFRNCIAGG